MTKAELIHRLEKMPDGDALIRVDDHEDEMFLIYEIDELHRLVEHDKQSTIAKTVIILHGKEVIAVGKL